MAPAVLPIWIAALLSAIRNQLRAVIIWAREHE